jgi:predicted DNA-binding transcriptional regulator AlpA
VKDKFLRIDEVMSVTGLSQSTIYRMEQAGQFPQREEEVRSWMESRENKRPVEGGVR